MRRLVKFYRKTYTHYTLSTGRYGGEMINVVKSLVSFYLVGNILHLIQP